MYRYACHDFMYYIVQQWNLLQDILVHVLAMVVYVMTTKLQMMFSPVYNMVVDVMITQNVCAIWQMSKVIVFTAITTTQDVL